MTTLRHIPWDQIYEQVRANIPRLLRPSAVLSNLRAQHAALTGIAQPDNTYGTRSSTLQIQPAQNNNSEPIPVTIHLSLQVSDAHPAISPTVQKKNSAGWGKTAPPVLFKRRLGFPDRENPRTLAPP